VSLELTNAQQSMQQLMQLNSRQNNTIKAETTVPRPRPQVEVMGGGGYKYN